MKISPRGMAIIYFLMGVLFTYMAIQSAEETVWNITTILFALIASLDFGVGLRMMSVHRRLKKEEKKE